MRRADLQAIVLCALACLLLGCESVVPTPVPRAGLPVQQVEMIPADLRPDLTDVVEIAPSYSHWGLEGWILYLPPRAAATPGLCDLPARYVQAPGIRSVRPNDTGEVKIGLRWALLDEPLSGQPQEDACRDLQRPSRNIAWFAPDGEARVAAGATVLWDLVTRVRRNDPAVLDAVLCQPENCARQRANLKQITPDLVTAMHRSEASEGRPYATWSFQLDDRAADDAGIVWVDGPPRSGAPFLNTPETPAPGRRVSLTRLPSF